MTLGVSGRYGQPAAAAEMQEDIAEYDRIKARIERGEEELMPAAKIASISGFRGAQLLL